MNQHKMNGDYVVTGLVTGTHVIEDINVPVPHQVAVRIPADLAHRSKDLWRGIQQKRLFLLKGGSGLTVIAPPVVETPKAAKGAPKSTSEETRLRKELAAARKESAELRKAFSSQGEKLEAILAAIGELGQGAPLVGVRAAVEAAGAVGGDVPMFIPKDVTSKDTEASIKVAEDAVEGTSVADAASTLRNLRKGSSPD